MQVWRSPSDFSPLDKESDVMRRDSKIWFNP
jgi:hypothetical protein